MAAVKTIGGDTLAMLSLLGLADVNTTREVRAGFAGRRTRLETYTFADWTVDGLPLRDLVRLQGGGPHPTILGPYSDVTYLVEGSDEAVPQIERLLGHAPADFPDERVALLVCAFDWDLGCGALSAQVDLTPQRVYWRNLGWQADCDPEVDYLSPALTFGFERPAYDKVLQTAKTTYGPADASSIRGATWG